MQSAATTKRFLVAGRVQGVGYREFVRRTAERLQVRGYTMNLPDGRVEVLAMGSQEQLQALAGRLRQGPPFAEVRAVEEQDAAVLPYEGFHIRRA